MRVLAPVFLAAALLLTVATSATGAPARTCPALAWHGSTYTVIAHGMTCSTGRKRVLLYLRHRKHPRGYRCEKPSSGSNVKVDCVGRTRPRGDPNYRFYLAIRR